MFNVQWQFESLDSLRYFDSIGSHYLGRRELIVDRRKDQKIRGVQHRRLSQWLRTSKMRFRHSFQTIYLRMNSMRTIDYATYEKKSSSREEIATSSLLSLIVIFLRHIPDFQLLQGETFSYL